MKVMDVSIEEQDCNAEMVKPPKKKMKQALLPYKPRPVVGPSMAIRNKKRKRTEKVANNKPNATKRVKQSDEVEVIELGLTEDEVEEVDGESSEVITIEEKKESTEIIDEDPDAAKGDEKIEKESETEVKKKRDYSVLDMFLKKAQSKDAKDDIQLLAMSDYESGNSKDSDGSSKAKLDGQIVTETPKEVSSKESNSETDKKENNAAASDTELQNEAKSDKVLTEELNGKMDEKGNDAAASDTELQNDVNSDQDVEPKTGDEENQVLSLDTTISDGDSTCKKKDSVTSDDNDAKNVDSDSDIGVLTSDDDADDEPDKSSNENEKDRDKSSEGNGGSRTPQSDKSNALRNRKLTPKQIERRLQNAKKREEKQRLKQEKEKKREEERENRRKEREERRKEKEEKEKLEKEQKRKEKEMKELKKQMETEQKQKEKEAKEEERRKREEEKLEAERKKQKAASNFANFFVAKKQETKAAEEDNVVKDQNFMPFEVKVDMRIAPISRRNLNNQNKLNFDGLFNKGVSPNKLYLNELKLNRSAVGRSEKTWPYEAKDDLVIIDEGDDSSDAVDPGSTQVTEKHHPKLFMFAENRRPPFWGTWRKKSDHISPRRPFAKDSKWFDYDIDSDDEWEEEEPGESIRGSDDERDEEGPEENEYDVDNDFMVPHGYLSDEEAKADEEDGEDMSPETQKLKLKLLGEQFEAERKTKTSKIKPKVIGCVWQGSVNSYPENTAPHVMQILVERQAWVREIPLKLSSAASSVSETLPASRSSDCGSPAPQTPGAKKKRVPEEAIPNLIRLVHGNINGRIFLIKEFMAFWEKNKTGDRQISKLSLSQKIKEIAAWIACPEEGPMHLRSCWYVREDVRKEYNCLDVTLPNRWEYTLRPTRRSDLSDIEKPEKIERDKKRIPLITQFTKKITQEEMQKQLVSKSTTSQSKPPKRVALISVPRGEQFQLQSSVNTFLTKLADPKKTEENQEVQLAGDRGAEKQLEIIHDVDILPGEDKSNVAKNGTIDSGGNSISDEKNVETSGDGNGGNLEADNKKPVTEGTEVNEIKNESSVAEPMETEIADDVITIED